MKLGTYYEETYVLRYLSLSPTTVQGYESSYHLHVEPQWADWEMHEIRVRHINTWLATAFVDNPGGAEKAYKVLRQILRSAMADECYPDDVVDPTTRGVRLPKKPWRGEPQHLTPKYPEDDGPRGVPDDLPLYEPRRGRAARGSTRSRAVDSSCVAFGRPRKWGDHPGV